MRVSKAFPLWLLVHNPEARIAIASYEAGTARRWGRYIRNAIRTYPQLGLKVREDTAAAHEWQLDGHEGGVYTVGVGGALTGRPVGGELEIITGARPMTSVGGVLIIDDPLKGRAEADSATYREACMGWWQETASTRLAPGTPVVGIMTRWHEDDMAGQLTRDPRWTLVNIPAQAEEDDPLGRQPGEYLQSARGRTDAQWEQIKAQVGSRGWNALYQGRPSPAEGGIFKRDWWKFSPIAHGIRRSDGTMHAPGFDTVMISVDATFKDSKDSDFVVMQVWGKRGARAVLLDQARGRWDFPTTCAQLVSLAAKWPQAALKLIEDKANGPAIIAQLKRQLPGMVGYTPKDSKEARANAVVPFVEAGNVELPDPQLHPFVRDLIEEAAAFPNGSHDDQVDAMTQALHRLLLGSSLQSFVEQLRAVS